MKGSRGLCQLTTYRHFYPLCHPGAMEWADCLYQQRITSESTFSIAFRQHLRSAHDTRHYLNTLASSGSIQPIQQAIYPFAVRLITAATNIAARLDPRLGGRLFAMRFPLSVTSRSRCLRQWNTSGLANKYEAPPPCRITRSESFWRLLETAFGQSFCLLKRYLQHTIVSYRRLDVRRPRVR
jgi:hypothetical protein